VARCRLLPDHTLHLRKQYKFKRGIVEVSYTLELVAGQSLSICFAPELSFAFLSNEVPGAFAIIGNGASAHLHSPDYDFADEAAPYGVAYWVRLAEAALPLGRQDAATRQESKQISG